MNPTNIYSITTLNRYIKNVFEQDKELKAIYLKGEISNFKSHYSGHFYFTLKDSESRISAIMFAMNAANLNFTPKDGDEVLVFGAISIYPAQGTYQIYVYEMEIFGIGKQLVDLEKLKKKLYQEGLFDPTRKKEIKRFPSSIGLITAKNSAALKDLTTNLIRRYSLAEIYIFPSLVQGDNAAKDLIKNLKIAYTYPLDTIIIGRGGGANEDLSAFNDETLVRTIALSPIPIIAAVGHEIDTTLTDFVADKRASTPTGACELAVPDRLDLLQHLATIRTRMEYQLKHQISSLRKNLNDLKNRPFFINPGDVYRQKRLSLAKTRSELQLLLNQQIGFAKEKIHEGKIKLPHAIKVRIQDYNYKLNELSSKLQVLNPHSVLARGYSFMETEDGHIVTSVAQINRHEIVKTTLKDGIILSKILEKEEK